MAVYKQPKSKYWWYKFVWNGDVVRESTKQTNKRVAEQMEAAHRTALAKGEVGIRERKPVPTLAQFADENFLPFVRATKAEKPPPAAHSGSELDNHGQARRARVPFERIAPARATVCTKEGIVNKLAARLLFFSLLSSPVEAQEVATRYTIQYTGRTFGYARIPDEQTPATDPVSGPPNQAARAYSKLFASSNPEGPVLRLGMGDNFAPNLFARVYRMPPASVGKEEKKQGKDNWCHPDDPDILVPKDRFYLDTKPGSPTFQQWVCMNAPPGENPAGNTEINYDNVAQFFIANKYNALVPGKHDFYFGPEWLRDVARLLAKYKVHMLGANLAISTARGADDLNKNTYPRIPDRYASLKYGTDFGPVSVDLPDMVFPYKRQFVIKNARQVFIRSGNALVQPSRLDKLERKDVNLNPLVSDVRICAEAPSSPHDPRNIPLPGAPGSNCMELVPSEMACAAGSDLRHLKSSCMSIFPKQNGIFDASTNRSHPTADETYLFKQEESRLSRGTNYLFCVHLNGIAPKPWTCVPFSVQVPFRSPHFALQGCFRG